MISSLRINVVARAILQNSHKGINIHIDSITMLTNGSNKFLDSYQDEEEQYAHTIPEQLGIVKSIEITARVSGTIIVHCDSPFL